MTLLQDTAIRALLDSRHVRIGPVDADGRPGMVDPAQIQPTSVDLCLGNQFRTLRDQARTHVSTRILDVPTDLYEVGGAQPYMLRPGGFVLATTEEAVWLPDDIAGRIEGKSSIGRLGILIHAAAGWVDPGFRGQITLEFFNAGPLAAALHPGDRIGQLCLYQLPAPAARPYGSAGLGSRYQGQIGPTAARPPAG
jgi:dCTP deaminase